MIYTPEQQPEYFEFASRVLNADFQHGGGCKVFTALYDDGQIAAVTVYSRFTPNNLEMSIATDGEKHWASRQFLFQSFAYPFLMLGKRRVMGVVEDGNESALHLDRRLGFVEEGRLRKWFGERDGILFGMLREECRWLRYGR